MQDDDRWEVMCETASLVICLLGIPTDHLRTYSCFFPFFINGFLGFLFSPSPASGPPPRTCILRRLRHSRNDVFRDDICNLIHSKSREWLGVGSSGNGIGYVSRSRKSARCGVPETKSFGMHDRQRVDLLEEAGGQPVTSIAASNL